MNFKEKMKRKYRKCKCGCSKLLVKPNEFNGFSKARYICAAKSCPFKYDKIPKPVGDLISSLHNLLQYVDNSPDGLEHYRKARESVDQVRRYYER